MSTSSARHTSSGSAAYAISIIAGFMLTNRHSPMAKINLNWEKENHTFANLAKPEIPHTTKIYFSYWFIIQDNPYLVK